MHAVTYYSNLGHATFPGHGAERSPGLSPGVKRSVQGMSKPTCRRGHADTRKLFFPGRSTFPGHGALDHSGPCRFKAKL